MGGAGSKSSSTTDHEQIFLESSPTVADSKDMDAFLKKMRELLIIHKNRAEAFSMIASAAPSVKLSANISGSFNDAMFDFLTKTKMKDAKVPDFAEHLKHLMSVSAVYVEPSEDEQELLLKTFPDFDTHYAYYINELSIYASKTQLELTSSKNIVNTPELTAIRNKTRAVINQYYSRIMFYGYSIIYNDYISTIYTMFAINQLRLLNAEFRKLKKQGELEIILKKLDEGLSSLTDDVESSNNAKLQLLREKVGEIDTVRKEVSTRAQTDIAQTGGFTILQDIVAIHDKKKRAYDVSNKYLENYFMLINSILRENSERLLEFYKKLVDDHKIINSNLWEILYNLSQSVRLSDVTETDEKMSQLFVDLSEKHKINFTPSQARALNKKLKLVDAYNSFSERAIKDAEKLGKTLRFEQTQNKQDSVFTNPLYNESGNSDDITPVNPVTPVSPVINEGSPDRFDGF